MLKELILEADLSPRISQLRLQMHLPTCVDPGPIAPPQPESAGCSTFPLFSRLPAELRQHVWRLAAADQPIRLLEWATLKRINGRAIRCGARNFYALNAPRHIPLAAQACSESWRAFTRDGYYIRSRDRVRRGKVRSPNRLLKGSFHWCSPDDIHLCSDYQRPSPEEIPLLAKNRTFAVPIHEFNDVEQGSWSWLYEFPSLTTLFVILAEQRVMIFPGEGMEVAEYTEMSGQMPHETYVNHVHTLVPLDDEDRTRLESLDRHWAYHIECQDGTEEYVRKARWSDCNRPGTSIASSRTTGERCLQCHLDLWETHWLDRIKAMWAGGAPGKGQGLARESGDRGQRKAKRPMPVIRPAVVFKIGLD